MADNTHNDDGHEGGGHHVNYFRIYIILLVLFLISVMGPEVGERTGLTWITLVTAFGIALVKANLVIQNFMHLRWEKQLMKWMLVSSLICVALFVGGVAPDVLNHEGNNWENVAAKAAVERGMAGEHGDEEAAELVAEVEEPAGFSAAGAYSTTCATCHGAAGDGAGPAGGALDPAPADFTDPAFWETRDRERLIGAIRDGAASVGGSALMVAWGFAYDDEQIGQIVDYLETFRPGGD